jgi:hypothetical protein
MNKDEENNGIIDKANVFTIAHLLIRDPDTGETILSQRDKESKKKND